jgi:hypothetical protein
MIILIPLLTSHPLLPCVIDVAFDRSILFNSIISWFPMIFPLGLVLTQCHRLNVRFLLFNGGVLEHHLWLPVISSHRSFFSLSRLSPPPWLLLFVLSCISRDWLWPRFIYFLFFISLSIPSPSSYPLSLHWLRAVHLSHHQLNVPDVHCRLTLSHALDH